MDKLEIVKALLMDAEATKDLPFEIGKAYFLRTVTYHIVGRVRKIVGKFLVLDDAAWVADSARFADAMSKGTLSEVEPVPDGWIVNTDCIADAGPWTHRLPLSQQ